MQSEEHEINCFLSILFDVSAAICNTKEKMVIFKTIFGHIVVKKAHKNLKKIFENVVILTSLKKVKMYN